MTENAGIKLDKYLESKGPLPGPQVVRLACQLAQVMGSESESETGSRSPVLHVGRIAVTTSGKIDITPSDETDLGLPIVASFPHHASPEEISGEAGDFRSSLYSLGCTLFEISTGELPYSGDSPKEVLKAHLNDEVPNPGDRNPDISKELARVIQELLRKNPEQRIQNVPELLRRLKICLGIEASSNTEPAGTPPPAPAGEEQSATGESPEAKDDEEKKEKKSPAPKLKLSLKSKESKEPGKSPEKKIGKSAGKAGRKVPSFSKKKSGDQPAKKEEGSKKSFTFSKKKSDGQAAKKEEGSKKSFAFSKKKSGEPKKSFSRKSAASSSSATSGALLSGKLIDRGDEGDIFEDSFEAEEQFGYSVVKKKSKPFMMAGAGLGLVLAILVIFSSKNASKEVVRARKEKREHLATEMLAAEKQDWRDKYAAEKTEVDQYIAKMTNQFNSGYSPTVIDGSIERQLEIGFFNKPGAVALAELYARVHARAEEIKTDQKETELGVEGNFEGFVNSFNTLYDQGLWWPACNKILEAENDYRSTKQKEIDELFFKGQNAMLKQWETDEMKIKDFALEGEPQKAIQVAENAKLYGHRKIQNDATAYIQSIRTQASISGEADKEENEAEEPEEGGLPADLDAELEKEDSR